MSYSYKAGVKQATTSHGSYMDQKVGQIIWLSLFVALVSHLHQGEGFLKDT